MKEEINREFQVVLDAVETCAEHIKFLFKVKVSELMNEVIEEANKFELQLKEKIKVFDPENLRTECILFLRDKGVKDSFKGTEHLIYILLNYSYKGSPKFQTFCEDISNEYDVPITKVRSNLINVLRSFGDPYATSKDALFTVMRDWEIYKKERGLG